MKPFEVISAVVDERGITVAELSRRTGINAELLRRSLAGSRNIYADEFIALCNELHLTIDNFKEVA